MFSPGEYDVGVSVARRDPGWVAELAELPPDPDPWPSRLGELLPVAGMTDAQVAGQLLRLQGVKAQLEASQAELIDELAERVQSLGGIAVGDPRHAAELSTSPRPPDGAEEVAVMIDRTLRAHETVIGKVRDAIEATEESKDWGTNDLLMGDVLRAHELQVWFLSEHVVDMPLVDAVSSVVTRRS